MNRNARRDPAIPMCMTRYAVGKACRGSCWKCRNNIEQYVASQSLYLSMIWKKCSKLNARNFFQVAARSYLNAIVSGSRDTIRSLYVHCFRLERDKKRHARSDTENNWLRESQRQLWTFTRAFLLRMYMLLQNKNKTKKSPPRRRFWSFSGEYCALHVMEKIRGISFPHTSYQSSLFSIFFSDDFFSTSSLLAFTFVFPPLLFSTIRIN